MFTKSYETYNEKTGLGALYLKKDLWYFLVHKENLNPNNPIIDLSGHSVIRFEVSSRCKTLSDVKKSPINKRAYPSVIYYKPQKLAIEQGRIHLDAESIHQINLFIIYLRNELLHENVLHYAQAQGIHLEEKYHERKQGIARIQGNVKIQNVFLKAQEKYGDVDIVDWETFKRAEYRLRMTKMASSEEKTLLPTYEILKKMLKENI